MTWKRCAGCTRAISETAFSCEYCGHVCDDVMDRLPVEEAKAAASNPGEDDMRSGAGDALAVFESGEPWDQERPRPAFLRTIASSEYPTSNQSEHADEAAAQGIGPLDIAFDHEPAPLDVAFETAAESSAAQVPAPRSGDPQAAQADAEPAAVAASGTRERAAGKLSPRHMAMAGAGVVAAGVLVVITMGVRGSAAPSAPVAPAARPRAGTATPANAKAATPPSRHLVQPPHWSRVNDGRWVGTSRHSAAFEVSAAGRIHVWTRDVTPVLVVRCDAGRTEAFVYTQSAARMEPQDGDHTVSVAFDEGSATSARWPDSAEHDALFARDGADFVRQLAAA